MAKHRLRKSLRRRNRAIGGGVFGALAFTTGALSLATSSDPAVADAPQLNALNSPQPAAEPVLAAPQRLVPELLPVVPQTRAVQPVSFSLPSVRGIFERIDDRRDNNRDWDYNRGDDKNHGRRDWIHGDQHDRDHDGGRFHRASGDDHRDRDHGDRDWNHHGDHNRGHGDHNNRGDHGNNHRGNDHGGGSNHHGGSNHGESHHNNGGSQHA